MIDEKLDLLLDRFGIHQDRYSIGPFFGRRDALQAAGPRPT